MAGAFLVTNRRAGERLTAALHQARAAQQFAGTQPVGGEARVRLADTLHELRESADGHAGEWWQRPVPLQEVAQVEKDGHRMLALLTERQAAHA
jgi:hypothetical protein